MSDEDFKPPKNVAPPERKTEFNVNSIKTNVEEIKQVIFNMELEGKTDPFDFELRIMETHPVFYQSNPFLVKKLCKKEDISMLYKMLSNLAQVESGEKSIAGVELKLGAELANQYIYPKLDKNK